ncbi:hypothetical protein BH10BAC4_BH10BAC4_14740 [soil metagenome]
MRLLRKALKFIGYMIGGLVTLAGVALLFVYIKSSLSASATMDLLGKEAPVLEVEGHLFRDLNKNGKLDVYEDINADIADRIEDLASQMTLDEKAGLMFIIQTPMNEDGSLSNAQSIVNPISLAFESNVELVAKKKMNHFNLLQVATPEALISWNNNIQKLAERTRLGIPVTLGTDPRHGVPDALGASIFTPYFSQWCSTLGFGAIGDTVLMREFGDIARQEYKAVGFRLTLSPQADLSTEPRWWRVNTTFGEDAELSAKLTKAYILGLQGDTLNNKSVACMVKHFAGGGPQENGGDAHFPPGKQVYPGNNVN